MVIIKELTSDNVKRVAEIEKQCFSDPWSEQLFVDELNNDRSKWFVAEDDGEICGYGGIYWAADEGYITNIAVDNNFRRKGIGKAILNKIIEFADGLTFITLEVRASNIAAISLYDGFGFEKEGLRKDYYNNPVEDAVLMTRRKHEDTCN